MTVTDTAGNTYTPLPIASTTTGAYGQWFYCLNAAGNAANVTTAAWSPSMAFRSLRVLEFSATSPVFEQQVSASNPSNSTTVASPSFSTAGAGLVLVGVSQFNAETGINFGANYTALANAFNYSKEAYRITTGALAGEVVTYTGGASSTRSIKVVTFAEGGGAGVTGNADITLGGLSVSSSGAVSVKGNASVILGGLSLAAAGATPISANAAATFGPLSVSASAAAAVSGGLTATLGGLSLSATAVTDFAGVTGGLTATLGALGVTAAGAVSISCEAAISFGGLTLAASGVNGEQVASASEKIRRALEMHLNAMAPALDTAYENASYAPVTGRPYQRVTMIYGPPDDRVMGCDRYREIGIFQVTLCYPVNKGPNPAQDRADAIRAWFKRRTVLENGGQYVSILETPKKQTLGNIDDRYNVAVSISYSADVIG